jgi:hypothetical protein
MVSVKKQDMMVTMATGCLGNITMVPAGMDGGGKTMDNSIKRTGLFPYLALACRVGQFHGEMFNI